MSPDTTYYVRAYAANTAGTSYGNEVSFTTNGIAPTVSTQDASDITATSAVGNGNISDLGIPNPSQHGVCWNTGGSPTTADSKTEQGAVIATGAFTSSISGLSPNTTYYVRAYTANSAGTSYGAQVSFITLPQAPTVTTEPVSGITSNSATGNGTISSLGGPNPTAYGVCWSTSADPTTADSKTDEGAAGSTGVFTSSITGLSPNTTYYVRAYATNTAGTSYGNEVSFTTNGIAPTVSTQDASDITATSAVGNGNISDLGIPNPSQHGVCWNTGGSPTTADSKTEQGAVIATGAFTSSISGLSPNTTYYVRAYTANSAGTSYGAQVSFITLPQAPTVTTEPVSGITSNSATGNGTISSLGGPNPTAYGVCWSTSADPTTADSKTDKGAAGSTGAFTSSITGLSANTTYYVRAYATNTAGTSYGNEVSFTTSNSSSNSGSGGGSSSSSSYNSDSFSPGSGGTLSLGTRVNLSIPSGAIQGTAPVKVKITRISSPPAAPSGFMILGNVFEMSVNGSNSYDFNEPVTLTFKFDPNLVPTGIIPAVYYFDTSSEQWINIGGTVSGNIISVAVDHFTQYAVFINESASQPELEEPGLTDIDGHWAEAAIRELVDMEVIKGYADGTFKPDQNITRAEFTVVLVKALNISSSTPKTFDDISTHWGRDYIAIAAGNGIINGYNSKTFGPNDPINREQMAVIIAKAAKLDTAVEGKTFADDGNISVWAKEFVNSAAANDIINGYADNTFRPKARASRAEALSVISKLLE